MVLLKLFYFYFLKLYAGMHCKCTRWLRIEELYEALKRMSEQIFYCLDQQDSFLHVPGLIRNLFKHHGVESLRLSLTQGFWRSNIWGLRQLIDVPSGTFLLVKFRTNERYILKYILFVAFA